MPIVTLPRALPWVITSSPVVPTPVATYQALIGGTLVNVVAGSISIQNQIGQRSQGSISVWGPLGVSWQYGTQAIILDTSGTIVYAGYVARDRAKRGTGARQGIGYLEHDLTLIDNCYRADKRVVFKSYVSVTAGAIVTDLLASYLAAEGVISTSSSIATGPTIVQVIWSGTKTVSEALTWLAERAGYWWNIDMDGVLWFQPYGGVSAPFALDGTTVDALQDLTVEYGNDLLVSKQYVKGSTAETAVLTETFKGDGVSRSFTLSYPVSVLQSVTLNAVDITPLVLNKGDQGGMFYVLVADPVIAQDPAQIVLATTDTLVVTYKGQYPVLASAQNPDLIAAQKARERTGTGLIESVYSDTKVRTLPAAFQIASSTLAHYGADVTVLTFSTQTAGLVPGQLLPVTLTDFGLTSEQMVLIGVTVSDQRQGGLGIWYTITAVGSSSASNWAAESAQWQTYWARLMSQSSDPSDYTDASNTALALLSSSTFTAPTPTVTITTTKAICPIIGNSTIISNTLIVC